RIRVDGSLDSKPAGGLLNQRADTVIRVGGRGGATESLETRDLTEERPGRAALPREARARRKAGGKRCHPRSGRRQPLGTVHVVARIRPDVNVAAADASVACYIRSDIVERLTAGTVDEGHPVRHVVGVSHEARVDRGAERIAGITRDDEVDRRVT